MTPPSPERKAVALLTALHVAAKRPREPLAKTKKRDRQATVHWGWKSHIRGVGFGYKRTQGKTDLSVPCLTIYVRRKFPRQRLPRNEYIPGRLFLADLGQEVQTDVIEVRRPIVAHAASSIQPGQDIAHQFGELGTLGLLVQLPGDAAVLGASCSHVMARSGVQASEGDFVEHPPLFTTSNLDQNEFGELTKFFTQLNVSEVFEEDFALARIDVPHQSVLSTNGTIVQAVADPGDGFTPGLQTSIQGFRSVDSPGQVINPSWSGEIQDIPFVGTVKFQNLVPYSTQCAPGDSGACVLEQGSATVLGLHIGGSSEDQFGLFMPLRPVFTRLQLTLAN